MRLWACSAVLLLAACSAAELKGQLLIPGADGGPEPEARDATTSGAGDGAPRPDAGPARDATPAGDAEAPDAAVAVRCGDSICAPSESCASCAADCGDCGWPAASVALEDEMLVLVNQQRAQGASCGGQAFGAAPALQMNAELRQAARLHSKDMADRDYFDHTSLEGKSPWDRIGEAGYTGSAVGENIAAGNETAAATFQQWLTSPGHCRNMMSADATEIGVGHASNGRSTYVHYWTQTFGRR